MVDRIGKKLLEIVGLTLVLLSTLLPIFQIGLGAEEVNYVADDIYFVDGNSGMATNEIKVDETASIGIVNENTDDTGLIVTLPNGVLLDQEGTKTLNADDQQIMYSEGINQIVVTYGQNNGRTNLSLLIDSDFETGSVVTTVTRNDNDYSNTLNLVADKADEIQDVENEEQEEQESTTESEVVSPEQNRKDPDAGNDEVDTNKNSARSFEDYPKPIKVGDREGSDLTDDKIEFTIYQTIPSLELLEPFELQVDLVDQINEVLIIDDITVEVEGGGVSDDFIVTNVDNLVVAAAKPLSLLDRDFYGKTYAMTIETHLNAEADWSPYYNPETQLIEIDNVGHALGVDLSELEVSLDSNVATGVIPVPEDSDFFVRKNVFDEDGNDITGRPGDTVYTGDLITYEIIVEIDPTLEIPNEQVIIEDRLQEGLEYVPGTTKADDVTLDDVVVWDEDQKNLKIRIETVPEIYEIRITFVVKVVQVHGQFVQNHATAGMEDPNNPGSAQDPKDSNIVSNPVEERVEGVIEANKYAKNANGEDITTIQPGEEFYYEIVVKNVGEENSILSELTVIDTLPTGVEYVASTTTLNDTPLIDGDVWSGTTLTVEIPDLEQNEQAVVKFKVKVTQQTSGNITNIAEVGDENPEVPIGIVLAEVLASKRACDADGNDITTVQPGEEFYYEIVISNDGDIGSILSSLTLTDVLPTGVEYVPGTTLQDDSPLVDLGLWLGNTLTLPILDLSFGEETVLKFKVKVTQETAGTIINIAEVGEEVAEAAVDVVLSHLSTIKRACDVDGNDITTIQPGEEFYYEIIVSNDGDIGSILKDIVVMDTLPAGVEYVSGSTTLNDVLQVDLDIWSGRSLTLPILDLSVGDTAVVRFKVMVTQEESGTITNIANVGDDNPEVPIEVVVPELSAEKIVHDETGAQITTIQPGEEFYYEIAVMNVGDEDSILKDVVVTDTLPSGVEYVAGTTAVNGVVQEDEDVWSGTTLTVEIPDLEMGEAAIVRFKVMVTQEESGTITNIANVGDEEPEVPVEVVVPEISAEKNVTNIDGEGITVTQPGEEIYYEIVVSNIGDEGSILKDVVVMDILPSGVEYVAGTTTLNDNPLIDGDVWSGPTLTVEIPDLEMGDEAIVRFKVLVTQQTAGIITNTANVGEEEPEVPIEVVVPEMTSEKKAYNEDDEELTIAQPGEEFYYEIVVTNVGEEDSILEDVVVVDTLPSGVEYIAGTTTLNGTPLVDGDVWSGTTLTVELPDLEMGDEAVVRFKVMITQQTSGTIRNMANVGNQEPEVSVEVVVPELTATKTAYNEEDAEVTTVNTGDTIYYKIVVTNNAEEAVAEDVLINDDLPMGVEYVTGSTTLNGMALTDGDVWTGNHVSVNVGDLDAGEGVTVEFAVTITTAEQIEITNIALVGEEDPENPGEPVDPLTPEATVIVVGARLEGNKRVTTEGGNEIHVAQTGDIIYYEIIVRNVGEAGSIAEDLLVQDNLPAGLEYVPDSTTLNGNPVSDGSIWNDGHLSISIEEIPSGEEYVVRFATKITKKESGVIKNVAIITADIDSPDPENEIEIVNPKLESSKDVFGESGNLIEEANKGDTVFYEVVAKNTGDDKSVLRDVIMKDVLPEGIEYAAGTTEVNGQSISDDVWNGNTLSYNAGDINSGEQVAIRFEAKITFSEEGTLRNIALIGEEDPDNPGEPKNPQEPSADLEVNEEMEDKVTSGGNMLPFLGAGAYLFLTILGFVIVSLILPVKGLLKK